MKKQRTEEAEGRGRCSGPQTCSNQTWTLQLFQVSHMPS